MISFWGEIEPCIAHRSGSRAAWALQEAGDTVSRAGASCELGGPSSGGVDEDAGVGHAGLHGASRSQVGCPSVGAVVDPLLSPWSVGSNEAVEGGQFH